MLAATQALLLRRAQLMHAAVLLADSLLSERLDLLFDVHLAAVVACM
jgi:hypothetical protein